jgi:hypothetical protein
MSETKCTNAECALCERLGRLNQRPTSYGTGGKAVVSEKPPGYEPKLTTEQVIAELKRLRSEHGWCAGMGSLIDQLPDPPRVDVVEECAKVMCASNFYSYDFDKLEDIHKAYARKAASEALRRYLELRGLPADPELEGK